MQTRVKNWSGCARQRAHGQLRSAPARRAQYAEFQPLAESALSRRGGHVRLPIVSRGRTVQCRGCPPARSDWTCRRCAPVLGVACHRLRVGRAARRGAGVRCDRTASVRLCCNCSGHAAVSLQVDGDTNGGGVRRGRARPAGCSTRRRRAHRPHAPRAVAVPARARASSAPERDGVDGVLAWTACRLHAARSAAGGGLVLRARRPAGMRVLPRGASRPRRQLCASDARIASDTALAAVGLQGGVGDAMVGRAAGVSGGLPLVEASGRDTRFRP